MAVSSPDIRCVPVVKCIDIVYAFSHRTYPLGRGTRLAPVDVLPAVKTFLSPYSDKACNLLRTKSVTEPKSETFLKLIVPHLTCVKIKILCYKTSVGDIPNPVRIRIPWPPITLV